ncbi:hypothetical protein FRB96_006387 [Tulasnella sp. 330]|nr:hypothetical protein FRB96_006387 [Tulasnella sp. 330]
MTSTPPARIPSNNRCVSLDESWLRKRLSLENFVQTGDLTLPLALEGRPQLLELGSTTLDRIYRFFQWLLRSVKRSVQEIGSLRNSANLLGKTASDLERQLVSQLDDIASLFSLLRKLVLETASYSSSIVLAGDTGEATELDTRRPLSVVKDPGAAEAVGDDGNSGDQSEGDISSCKKVLESDTAQILYVPSPQSLHLKQQASLTVISKEMAHEQPEESNDQITSRDVIRELVAEALKTSKGY